MKHITPLTLLEFIDELLADSHTEYPIYLSDPCSWLTSRYAKQLFPHKKVRSNWASVEVGEDPQALIIFDHYQNLAYQRFHDSQASLLRSIKTPEDLKLFRDDLHKYINQD